jgi:hypothetical protein
MKRWLFLLLFFCAPCQVYGSDVKFVVPVNLQGNSVTNVSTFTFKYGGEYSTMSVKLDEIAVATTSARDFSGDKYVSTSTIKVRGNMYVLGLFGFQK